MPAHRQTALLAALLALLFIAPAAAETWRCGGTYTDRPCEGGRTVTTEDRRDGTRQREADAAVRSAQSAADRMAQERLRMERSATGRPAVLIGRPPDAVTPQTRDAPKPRSGAQGRKQRTASEHFTAQGPGTRVGKKAKAKAVGGDRP